MTVVTLLQNTYEAAIKWLKTKYSI
jgi:hypothetical protein